MRQFSQQLPHYCRLMRLDKPVGTLLLLWPTLWALWFAAEGLPSTKNLAIFIAGVVLMRSAGCVINDYADRYVDGHVERTQQRPLATGIIKPRSALILFALLCLLSCGLVLLTNALTIKLSVVAVALAACYPFMKRITHLPQVILGMAFAWSIPMAFAAETGTISKSAWTLYAAVVMWTVAYDTFYAMVDREDDLKIGVKSTAILFGELDIPITISLQVLVIIALVMTGMNLHRSWCFFAGVTGAALLFGYQQWLIKDRQRDNCFKAFLNNQYVGLVIFVGIFVDYMVNMPPEV